MREVTIALNICTYKRQKYIDKNIDIIKKSLFFTKESSKYYKKLQVYVVDNASEIESLGSPLIHVIHNKNNGGSGGFQRGIDEIKKEKDFTHVIFMDDDVEFEIESLYILYDFLESVSEEYVDYPIAGRMICADKRNIQYTAAEKWNKGQIEHIEFLRDIGSNSYVPGKVIYDSGADYGGWWFCCYPMTFVKDNDIIPFFIHCDDVEYGLRCNKAPIIIEGVHVWHETYEKRITPAIRYYDVRNSLFVNEMYKCLDSPNVVYENWKKLITEFHIKEDYTTEYLLILAMRDFLKGLSWLYKIDSEKYHKKLNLLKGGKIKNAVSWRIVKYVYCLKYKLKHLD